MVRLTVQVGLIDFTAGLHLMLRLADCVAWPTAGRFDGAD
jgi:hypothetical protein